jgi:hypothetical protein
VRGWQRQQRAASPLYLPNDVCTTRALGPRAPSSASRGGRIQVAGITIWVRPRARGAVRVGRRWDTAAEPWETNNTLPAAFGAPLAPTRGLGARGARRNTLCSVQGTCHGEEH